MLNDDKLVGFAYSFQTEARCTMSFYGDFDASDVVETMDISLYVKNSCSKNNSIKLPVKLKKHSTSFKCLCVAQEYYCIGRFTRYGRGAELAIQAYVELLSENIDKLADLYKAGYFKIIEKNLSFGLVKDRWIRKIAEDLIKHPATQEELEEYDGDFKKDYEKFCEIKELDGKVKFIRLSSLKEIYDCEFIAYIQTKDFWYAMQIGDGDFAISYDENSFYRPVEKDDESHSFCVRESYKDCRFSHGEKIPKYVVCFSGKSDGDLSFRYEGLFNFYKWVVNRFINIEFDENENLNSLVNEIEKTKKLIVDSIFKTNYVLGFSFATILNFKKSDFSNYKKTHSSDSLDALKEELKGQIIQELKEKLRSELLQEIKQTKAQSNSEIDGVSPLKKKKTLVLYFLIDTSESMAGEKIQAVNEAISDMLHIIKGVAKEANAKVNIAVLSFNNKAYWETSHFVDLANYKYKDLCASGQSLMGEAFFELDSELSENIYRYDPVIILLSAGKPIDNYSRGLSALKQNRCYISAIKIAFAVGKDANRDVLAEFTGERDLVLGLNNKVKLKKLIRFIPFPSVPEHIDFSEWDLEIEQEELNQEIRDKKANITPDSDSGAW